MLSAIKEVHRYVSPQHAHVSLGKPDCFLLRSVLLPNEKNDIVKRCCFGTACCVCRFKGAPRRRTARINNSDRAHRRYKGSGWRRVSFWERLFAWMRRGTSEVGAGSAKACYRAGFGCRPGTVCLKRWEPFTRRPTARMCSKCARKAKAAFHGLIFMLCIPSEQK